MLTRNNDMETFVVTRRDGCDNAELIIAFVRAVNAKEPAIVPGMLGEDGRDRPIGGDPPLLRDPGEPSCIVTGSVKAMVEDTHCRIIVFNHAHIKQGREQ